MIDNKDWIIKNNNTFIQSKLLLKNGFSHAFFTKRVEKNSPKELVNYISRDSSIRKLKQIHSNNIIRSSKSTYSNPLEADGLISENKNKESLWIYSADCLPALFADSITRRVAAIHAGWRGLSKNILQKAIIKLEALGSERKNILVALGPCISAKNYEVSSDVIIEIYNTLNTRNSNKEMINILNSLKIIKGNNSRDKYLLDIRLSAYYQLINEGIGAHQISISKFCTFSDSDLFFSWRRNHSNNIQWSVIVS